MMKTVGDEPRIVPSRGDHRTPGGDKAPPLHGAVRRVGRWAVVLVTAGFLLGAPDAFACPVCYGEASGSMIDGAKLSVLFLGSLVYLVIGGGIGVVFLLRRRVRKNLDPHRGLHAVPGRGEPDLT